MTKGKAKVNYLGRSGVVMPQTTPSWDFIYKVSLIKHPKYEIGDRVVLPDGREYRHGFSESIMYTTQACHFSDAGAVGWTTMVVAASVGDFEITCPAGTHDAFTVDQLRGGYVQISGVANSDLQFRGIVGNDATAANVAFKIYLDGGLDAAVLATSSIEVFHNPYAKLLWGAGYDSANGGFVGPPAAHVPAASMYFWVQVKGPTWLATEATMNDKEGLAGNWRASGALDANATALGGISVPADSTTQYAGYRLAGSQSGNGPLFMLQG